MEGFLIRIVERTTLRSIFFKSMCVDMFKSIEIIP